MIKDKKGLLPFALGPAAALFFIILIAGIVGLIAFLTSGTIRFTIIGIAVFVAVVFLFGKSLSSSRRMSTGERTTLFVLVGVGLFFVLGSGILQETFVPSGSYIQVPAFGYYECAPATYKVPSPWNDIGSSGTGFVTIPKNAADADVRVRIPSNSLLNEAFSNYRVVTQKCDISTGTCESQSISYVSTYAKDSTYFYSIPVNILKNEKIFIDYQKKTLFGSWNGIAGSQYQWRYTPFIIWKVGVFNIGGRTPLTSITEGCSFNNYGNINQNNLLISETLSNVNIGQTSLSNSELQPYQTRGFIENIVPISVENRRIVTYQSQLTYCSNNAVYKIEEVKTNSGTYKVARLDISPISSVTCCPGDTDGTRVCTSEFKWQTITPDIKLECSAFNPCPIPSWIEGSSSKTLVKQTCQQNVCVPETKNVDCTRNTDCTTGQACDITLYTCVNVPGGTILEEGNVTENDCNKKALNQPILGWTWISEQSTEKTFLNKITFGILGSEKTTDKSYCKATFLPYIIFTIVAIILIVVTAIMLTKKRRKR